MTEDIRDQVVKGIRRYLDHQFPGTDVDHTHDAASGSVMFHLYAGATHYRLNVTAAFLEGEHGTEIAIQQLTDWRIAELLLDARERIVTLDTTGARVEPPEPGGDGGNDAPPS